MNLQLTKLKIHNQGEVKMFKRIFDFFKRLFSKIFKEKKPQAQWPKVVIPVHNYHNTTAAPKVEPLAPKKAKEYIRPEDPDYRHGSSHLLDLRFSRGLTTPITKNRPRKII